MTDNWEVIKIEYAGNLTWAEVGEDIKIKYGTSSVTGVDRIYYNQDSVYIWGVPSGTEELKLKPDTKVLVMKRITT